MLLNKLWYEKSKVHWSNEFRVWWDLVSIFTFTISSSVVLCISCSNKWSIYQHLSFITLCNICSEGNQRGGGDFIAGFLVGGAVFGTLAYFFAPQVIGFLP